MPCSDCAGLRVELLTLREFMAQWFNILLRKMEALEQQQQSTPAGGSGAVKSSSRGGGLAEIGLTLPGHSLFGRPSSSSSSGGGNSAAVQQQQQRQRQQQHEASYPPPVGSFSSAQQQQEEANNSFNNNNCDNGGAASVQPVLRTLFSDRTDSGSMSLINQCDEGAVVDESASAGGEIGSSRRPNFDETREVLPNGHSLSLPIFVHRYQQEQQHSKTAGNEIVTSGIRLEKVEMDEDESEVNGGQSQLSGRAVEEFEQQEQQNQHDSELGDRSWVSVGGGKWWMVKNKAGRFSCRLCSSSFSQISNLRRHVKVLHQQGGQSLQHQCRYCGKSFTWKGAWRRHEQFVHELRTARRAVGAKTVANNPAAAAVVMDLNAPN